MALSDKSGNKIEEYFYDACLSAGMYMKAEGLRKNPDNWSENDTRTDLIVDRGYTSHEHWDYFDLINMNGRVYDPQLGRFLSPDPVFQPPDYSQNFNKYSYVLNNPFKYTDPGGYNPTPIEMDINRIAAGNIGGRRFDFSGAQARLDAMYYDSKLSSLFGSTESMINFVWNNTPTNGAGIYNNRTNNLLVMDFDGAAGWSGDGNGNGFVMFGSSVIQFGNGNYDGIHTNSSQRLSAGGLISNGINIGQLPFSSPNISSGNPVIEVGELQSNAVSIIDVANSYLGLNESNDGNLIYNLFQQPLGLSSANHWCSAYVNRVVSDVGLQGTHSGMARSWLNWGTSEGDIPQRGQIAIFSRGTNPLHGHVGIVVGIQGNNILLLGGNQSDMVRVSQISQDRLLGLRWY